MNALRLRHIVIGLAIAPLLVLFLDGSALAGKMGKPSTEKIVPPADPIKTPRQELGDELFTDINLSNPPGQSCESCHIPELFWTDPDQQFPTSQGVLGLFGGRNAPTMGYLAFTPHFHFDAAEGLYVGGFFWDGRAKDAIEQAKGPFLNPIEMNATVAYVVSQVKAAPYADLFRAVYGPDSLNAPDDVIYHQIASAIADYQQQGEFFPFSSKYDWYLKGKTWLLTRQEKRGLALFKGKANCAACHPAEPAAPEEPVLFTDFTYDNLGIPKNPALAAFPQDLGLGAVVGDPAENGKFKVPTLRNIALTAPYGHNGYFNTLREIVEFYNTGTVPSGAPAEVPENVNRDELGNLGLTNAEITDLVAFLKTLTDGFARPALK